MWATLAGRLIQCDFRNSSPRPKFAEADACASAKNIQERVASINARKQVLSNKLGDLVRVPYVGVDSSVLHYDSRQCVPKRDKQAKLLHDYHATPSIGHLEETKTIRDMKPL